MADPSSVAPAEAPGSSVSAGSRLPEGSSDSAGSGLGDGVASMGGLTVELSDATGAGVSGPVLGEGAALKTPRAEAAPIVPPPAAATTTSTRASAWTRATMGKPAPNETRNASRMDASSLRSEAAWMATPAARAGAGTGSAATAAITRSAKPADSVTGMRSAVDWSSRPRRASAASSSAPIPGTSSSSVVVKGTGRSPDRPAVIVPSPRARRGGAPGPGAGGS